jgi:hypothetical protein
MKLNNIPVPSEYKKSQDFRFFIKWFTYALSKIQYDTTNMVDLYDALRCPENLLWLLGDTIGYRYDDRLCSAYNRFVILYFMSMMKYKGSQLGVTLAAEMNLKQKDVNAYGTENDILYNRLEDVSIPNNSVYVESDTPNGTISVVYFSDEIPIDACIEYVRPLGMYCFQYAGVRIDSLTKISVDARLAKASDSTGIIGPTKVGKYNRNDYARLQHMKDEGWRPGISDRSTQKVWEIINPQDTRNLAYARNSKIEEVPTINAGFRALNSLQISNNEHLVKSLFSKPIFNLGFGPTVSTLEDVDIEDPKYNLRYNRTVEQQSGSAVYTLDASRTIDYVQGGAIDPVPKVNGIMTKVGDAIIEVPTTVKTRVTELGDGGRITENGDTRITERSSEPTSFTVNIMGETFELKKVIEGGYEGTEGNFEFTLQDADGNYYDINGNNKGSAYTTIALPANTSVTISDLGDGFYKVNEVSHPDIPDYTYIDSGLESIAYVEKSTQGATVTYPRATTVSKYTYNYTGAINIKLHIVSDTGLFEAPTFTNRQYIGQSYLSGPFLVSRNNAIVYGGSWGGDSWPGNDQVFNISLAQGQGSGPVTVYIPNYDAYGIYSIDLNTSVLSRTITPTNANVVEIVLKLNLKPNSGVRNLCVTTLVLGTGDSIEPPIPLSSANYPAKFNLYKDGSTSPNYIMTIPSGGFAKTEYIEKGTYRIVQDTSTIPTGEILDPSSIIEQTVTIDQATTSMKHYTIVFTNNLET